MLEGPFRKDKKFIRFCNDSVVHLIRFEGDGKKTVEVKLGQGKKAVRSAHLPQFTIDEIDTNNQDIIDFVRGEGAPNQYSLPRLEIWSADKKSLHQQAKRGRLIPNAEIVAAAKRAQKKLGKPMSRKSYLLLVAAAKAVEQADETGDKRPALRALRAASAVKDATAAAKEELAELKAALE